jgi:hypothetical protein
MALFFQVIEGTRESCRFQVLQRYFNLQIRGEAQFGLAGIYPISGYRKTDKLFLLNNICNVIVQKNVAGGQWKNS